MPAEFSSDNLGDPSITYLDDAEVEVSLVCEASILKGIEKWLNVTYRVEWFAEGKSLKSEVICGGLIPGEQHQAPCQSVANAKVHSTLESSKYKVGQWVSPGDKINILCRFNRETTFKLSRSKFIYKILACSLLNHKISRRDYRKKERKINYHSR